MTIPQAQIHELAIVGLNVTIWAGSHVREFAEIGEGTSIGRDCYVGPGVVIGSNCKIQNHSLIYEPAVLGKGVFIGPGVVITNDLNPRAINPNGSPKRAGDWSPRAARIETGASLGAGVICVGEITVGEWAMVAAGALVTRDVLPHALVAGIPAKQVGWVGKAGHKLQELDGGFVCPITGSKYILNEEDCLIQVAE